MIFQSFILGMVQGLAEFLPISSSGHLILVPWLFGFTDPGLAFDVFLHAGTLFALVAYFWKDIVQIIRAFFAFFGKQRNIQDQWQYLTLLLIIATVPGAILGKLLEHTAETLFRNPLLVAIDLGIVGIILFFADRFGKKIRGIQALTVVDAVIIGCSQALALVPGVSRSGATIIAGLFLGLRRPDAARFSFLLAIPITLGSIIFKFKDAFVGVTWSYAVVGLLSSFVFGYLAIRYLLKFVQHRNFNIFVFYRLGLSVLVIALYFLNK